MTRRPPAAIIVAAIIGASIFVVLPLISLLQRTPWNDIGSELASPPVADALTLSLLCSVSAAALSAVFGIPIAWLLARGRFPGRSILRGLVIVPMVLPPVVGGVALLLAFGRRGLAGQWLDQWFNIRLPFTTAGAILAETFVAMPFMILTVEGGLRALEPDYEDAAATLGAGRLRTMLRVTAPMIAPALAAGAVLAWARALGEFGATITFAGNFQGKTQTLPLAVYVALESRPQGAIALSLILLATSLAVLITFGRRLWPDRQG